MSSDMPYVLTIKFLRKIHALTTATLLNEPVKASQLNKSAIRPIWVSPKSRKMPASLKIKHQPYVSPIFDDREHPSPQEDWEYIFTEVKAGRLLIKRKYNSHNLQDIDPDFGG